MIFDSSHGTVCREPISSSDKPKYYNYEIDIEIDGIGSWEFNSHEDAIPGKD